MSLLNVGARALLANQVALQTAGHNIANVNTPGYSRQTIQLESSGGQLSGNGFFGKGVEVVFTTELFSKKQIKNPGKLFALHPNNSYEF